METCKNLALVALGAAAVMAYQKYNEPVMRCVDRMVHKTMRKAKDEVSDMM